MIFQTTVFAQADLIVVNANIRTMDKTKPRAEAVAVTKNRISAVGTNEEIRARAGEGTKTIDARGRLVLPGFNDAHVHFAAIGTQFFYADLRDAKTPAEIAAKIVFHARFLPAGQWLTGGGWNEEKWAPNERPTKKLLDAVAPDRPVFLYRAGAKQALVNSFALNSARIDRATKDPPGGAIERDADGEPTGILKDAAMRLVKTLVPAATGDKSSILETASNYAAAFGVTSVQDVSADDNTGIYRALARTGKLKTRVYDCAALSDWRNLAKDNVVKASGDAFVRRGCVKGTADGEAETSGGLFEAISGADRAGLQIMIHAVGSRANEQILSIFERVGRMNGARDRRFRVEHAHGFYARDIKRFVNAGIIASLQPALFSDDAGGSLAPLRSLTNLKTTLAFGSDASMIPIDPLAGIAAAVGADDPKQSLAIEEAVLFYTAGSAYAEFQENAKGTLAVGKLADFVVLSADIFTIDPREIAKARVLTTVVDGRVVYQAD
ncbi:MAG TPA: amidohydrolase [Pyrinomonadaceae bacterium]